MSEARPSLRSRVLTGAVWAAGGLFLRHGLRLANNVILTRLLAPEAFGLMAIVNSFRTGMELVSDIGIAPSVIRSPRGEDPSFLATTFSLQAMRGAALWLAACVFASTLAGFYGHESLRWLVPAAASSLLIAGFNSPGLLLWRRNLQLRGIQAIDLVTQLVALAVSLAWVLVEPSVWGLVAGGVAASLTKLALSHAFAGQPVRFGWERSAARELISFGSWVFLSTLITFLADEADRLILGKLIPLAELGVYSIAMMFATLPGGLVASLGDWVVLPAFSRSLDLDQSGVRRTFARVRRPVVALGGALLAPGFAAAPAAIALLYDARYHEAGWMIQLLALGAWFRVLATPHIAAQVALGEVRNVAAGNAAKFVGVAIAVPGGFMLGGLAGALAGLVIADMLRWLAVAITGQRRGLGGLGSDLLETAAAVLAALLGWVAASQLSGGSAPLQLVVGAAVALAAWSPFVWRTLRSRDFLGVR